MFINDQSPFRRMPSRMDKRQLLFLVGIRYSIEIIDVSYRTLLRLLNDEGTIAKATSDTFPMVVSMAWSMIDSANRFRVLVEKMPHISQGPHFQAGFRKLAVVEDLRNPIQHLNQEIGKRVESSGPYPVWGTLSWMQVLSANPLKVRACVLMPGSVDSFRGVPATHPAGKVFHAPIDHVELSAYGITVSLSEMHETIGKLSASIEGALNSAFDGNPDLRERLGSDLILELEFANEQSKQP